MLKELRIRDLAVVDDLTVEVSSGLTAMTGETGAGKSIVVEALSLLVGGRPSIDMIRSGSAKAVVEGRFEIGDSAPLMKACEDSGIDAEDGWLILRRELRREGRHRAWVNASPATTSLLKALGGRLLDLHGQHEHQRLLDRREQRRILDAYGANLDLVAEVGVAHESVRKLAEELATVRETARAGLERSDYLRFKAEEIEAAGLEAGEDERLDAEARRLGHSEELIDLSGGLNAALYESEGSIVDRLGALGKDLGELARIDEAGQGFLDLHESALRAIEELGRGLGAYRDAVDHDPGRLDEIRRRMDEIYRLKRKYGDSVEAVIEAGRLARGELDGIEGADDEIARLEAAIATESKRLDALSTSLTAARRKAAGALEKAVESSLPELGLEGGRFEVTLEALESTGPTGAERVAFLVSLNPGFPVGPLNRVASGGEMSRLMLAMKTALVAVDEVPILVFDEVDAGIGGEVANRVGERLVGVASKHQVLVVTHLAQIAARADSHFVVMKAARDGSTSTAVTPIAGGARVEELARMLGGDPDSRKSRAHAEELLAGSSSR